MRNFVTLVALVLATTILWAQPDPNAAGGNAGGGPRDGMQGGPPPGMRGGMNTQQTLLVNTLKGIFMLRNGVLARFSLDAKADGAPLSVFGPMPAMPQNADQQTMMKFMQEEQKRNAPAIMVTKDNLLLIVIGDAFFRFDIEKMAQVGEITGLAAADAPAAGQQGMRMPEAAPGYLVVGNTLYLARATELLALDITTGKINSRLPLAKELQQTPRQGGPGQGGRGGQGGQGGQGGRGGRGGRGGNENAG
jgi:uncharacterized membrane protein YgcG